MLNNPFLTISWESTMMPALKPQESLRKDKANAKAQYAWNYPSRKAPILRLSAAVRRWKAAAPCAKLNAARPYKILKASCCMIIWMGQVLAHTPATNNARRQYYSDGYKNGCMSTAEVRDGNIGLNIFSGIRFFQKKI